jgi:hypothetical protein
MLYNQPRAGHFFPLVEAAVQTVKLCGLLFVAGVVGVVSCSAGGGKSKGDDGDSGPGGAGQGGIDLSVGTGTGGDGTMPCSDPTCIGSTPQGECDSGLALAATDAMDGARAIGLCQVAQAGTWGVVSAAWVRSDGTPLPGGDGVPSSMGTPLERGKGILDHFGNAITPREGVKLLGLSSGSARNPGEQDFNDPGGDWKDFTPHGSPPGYPKESPSCPGVITGEPYDSAGLELQIRTPTDAKSFKFEFTFYTYEYPDYVCSTFNDFFVAMMDPIPAGLVDGNISFDTMNNLISVNAGFLDACNPCMAGGKNFLCTLGYSEILGTGFESNMAFTCPIQGSASTSWLATTAPVESPGSVISLRFAVWDSGDGVLDSTVILDNFRFELGEGQVGTVPVPE